MTKRTPCFEDSFHKLVVRGLRETAFRLPIVLALLVAFAALINFINGRCGWEVFLRLLEPTRLKGIPDKYDPPLFVFLVIAGVLDAFVWAIYWYARVRNPRYIAKQEAHKRMKAERAAKQTVTNETGAADKHGNGTVG